MAQDQRSATKRLVRRRHDRFLGGVAGGIADYFDIDPVLVRVAFVAAAFFGGAGVIAYVAGWLLIPEEGAPTSIGEHALHGRHWMRIVGIVLLVVAGWTLLRELWRPAHGVLAATALIVLGIVLLRSHDDDRGDDELAHDELTHDAVDAEDAVVTADAADAGDPGVPPTEPVPTTSVLAPPRARRRGERRERVRGNRGVVALTLGVLLVGAGVVGLVVAAGTSIDPTRVFAGGVLVVGLGLVLSAWYGRGLGLLPVGLLLVVAMSASSLIDVPLRGGIGDRRVHPIAASELEREYHLAIGQLTVDLRDVDFAPASVTQLDATVGIGHLVVLVPRDVEVDVHGHSGAGEVSFLDDHQDGGLRVDRDATFHAAEGKPRLVLDAEVGIGQVEVRDAAA